MSLCMLLQYLNCPEGKREFNNKSLPSFSEENWALIEALCIIVGIFGIATSALSGEMYPIFVYTMPVLRSVKRHLSNDVLFTKHSNKSVVKQFYISYSDEPFLSLLLTTLKIILLGLLAKFKKILLCHDNCHFFH